MKQYLDRLSEIYRAIDRACSEALRRYGFSCDGCYRFIMEKENVPKDFRINRTNFYLEIAQIEREVREKINFTGRHKKTTAEMVLNIINGEHKAD
ncbi:MAG: hypothetical protein WA104_02600 [Thermodesulfovibrionales bacterium]